MNVMVNVGTGDNEEMAINVKSGGGGSWNGGGGGGCSTSAEYLAKVENKRMN
jgi:hypothetical protein